MTLQQLAKLTAAGAVERMRHGVYRAAGTPADPRDDLRAAWLALDPTRTAAERFPGPMVEVVSHRSAARLHGMGDLSADRLEFLTPARRQSRDPELRFRVRRLAQKDWTVLDGLPVTTALVTIRDLADDHLDGGHLAGAVRDAIITLHLHPEAVAGALAPHAHTYGAPSGRGDLLLRRMLEEAGVPRSTRALGDLFASQVPASTGRDTQALEGGGT